jgi:hypothetical protein
LVPCAQLTNLAQSINLAQLINLGKDHVVQ